MFGLPKPDRSPWRVGHDWTQDGHVIAVHDPLKRESMTRQALREMHACASLQALHAAWERHGRVAAALRFGGDHVRANEIADTFFRLCRSRAEAEEIASAEADAEAHRERP